MNQFEQMVDLAKKALHEAPKDVAHDYAHHYRVLSNAIEIITAETITKFNFDRLKVAIWWHDVDRGDKENPSFRATSKKVGLDQIEFEKILAIIDSHSIEDERDYSIESKLLFDADKIEYMGSARWILLTDAIRNGSVKISTARSFVKKLNAYIEAVFHNLNYKSSIAELIRMIHESEGLYKKGLFINEVADQVDWKLLNQLCKKYS